LTDSASKGEGRRAPEGGGREGGFAAPAGMEWMNDLLRGSAPVKGLPRMDKRYAEAMQGFMEHLASNPESWSSLVADYSKRQAEMMASLMAPKGGDGENAAQHKPDRRFAAEQWESHPFFSLLKNNYLLSSELLLGLLDLAPLEPEQRRLLSFVFNQYIDAMSPSNFPATNPEVIEATVRTGGANLTTGMQNLIEDMRRGKVSNTDDSAFSLGSNIAATPGKVIMQNRLVQLIEYAPRTDKVHEVPLVIFPPCINKYYILDLTPEKSLVNHLVGQGYRVFMASWVNAGEPESRLEWDDYLTEGIMQPMDAVRDLARQEKVNTLGFCIGGTLLLSALAVAAANGDHPAKSVTLLASMVDCFDTGDIGLFITEESVEEFDSRYRDGGLMSGVDLANTFAFLRPNDLVWPYVIRNYYLGESPPAFDILHWNADSVNLPGRMFAKYVRDTYLENNVAEGRSTMCGVKVDLKSVDVPVYAFAALKDHIVPWRSAYYTASRLGGPVEFVLGASGHIAGVVNPPGGSKRFFQTQSRAKGRANGAGRLPSSAEKWAERAGRHEGSWWPHWDKWLRRLSGKRAAAPRRAGNYKYKPFEDAPGSYVRAPLPPANPSQ
jgi:polyhydroxyalkanoate synthase